MNVLELVQMRAAVLSQGTEMWLRLAREQVKLCQVDVYATEKMTLDGCLDERVSGLVEI